MGDKTGIEWTDATWNPVVGCSVVSPGCTNCYAMKQAAGLERRFGSAKYAGLTKPSKAGPVWTGAVRLAEEALDQPLRWRRGRKIFVNSMSDLFHENLPDAAIDAVFGVMTHASQHIFQILTKRPERMKQWFDRVWSLRKDNLQPAVVGNGRAFGPYKYHDETEWRGWPLPNVWLGVSTEDQARADERIPLLLETPAAKRFISAEPLLGPISLEHIRVSTGDGGDHFIDARDGRVWDDVNGTIDGVYEGEPPALDWVIAGGESGPGARPMHPDWPRALRDQCKAAGVPFFFKQWGEHFPVFGAHNAPLTADQYDGPIIGGIGFARVGKKAAGALLDGVAHREFPQAIGTIAAAGGAKAAPSSREAS